MSGIDSMFKHMLIGASAIIYLSYLALYTEFHSLPHLHTTLARLIDVQFSYSFLIIASVLFVVPFISIILILTTLKKFVFNHIKNISKCYYRAICSLLLSYLAIAILACMGFLFDLAFREHYYFLIRVSYLIPNNYFPHMFTINLVVSLIVQASVFLTGFLLAELILTYKYKVTSIKFKEFIIKNSKSVVFTVCALCFNFGFLVWLEKNFFKDAGDYYYKSFEIVDKIIESSLISTILLYLYVLLVTLDG